MANLGKTWDLLVILLSHPSFSHLTLQAMDTLSRLMPSIIPMETLPLLIIQLGPSDSLGPEPLSAAPSDLKAKSDQGSVSSGIAAQILTQMIGEWKLAAFMSRWKELDASKRLIGTCLGLLPSINSSFWMDQISTYLSESASLTSSATTPPPLSFTTTSSFAVGQILQLVLRLLELGACGSERSAKEEILQLSIDGQRWTDLCLRCAQGIALESLERNSASEALRKERTEPSSSMQGAGLLHIGVALLERITSSSPQTIHSFSPLSNSNYPLYGPIAVWILSKLVSADGQAQNSNPAKAKARQTACISAATILSRPIFWSGEASIGEAAKLCEASSFKGPDVGCLWKSCRLGVAQCLKSWLLQSSAGKSSEIMRSMALLTCAILSSGPHPSDYGFGFTPTHSRASVLVSSSVSDQEAKILRSQLLDDPVTPIGQLLLFIEQHPPGTWALPSHIGSSSSSIQIVRDEERAVSFYLLRELASWGMRRQNHSRFSSFVSSLSSLQALRGGQRSREELKIDLARAASLSCVHHTGTSRSQGTAYHGLELDLSLSLCFLALTPSTGSAGTLKIMSWRSFLKEIENEGLDLLINSAMSICGREENNVRSKSQLSVEIVKALGDRGRIEASRLMAQHFVLSIMLMEALSPNEVEASILSLATCLCSLLLLLIESMRMHLSRKGDGSLMVMQPVVHTLLTAMLQLTAEKGDMIRELFIHGPASSKDVFIELQVSLESFLRFNCSIVEGGAQTIQDDHSIGDKVVKDGLREMSVHASLLLLRLFDQAGVPSSLFFGPSESESSWANPELSDISLVLPRSQEGSSIASHSVILERVSPALERKIQERRLKSSSRPLELTLSSSVESGSLHTLLDFMAKGSCHIPPSADYEKLAKLAKALQIDPLSSLLRFELPFLKQRISPILISGPHLSPSKPIHLSQNDASSHEQGNGEGMKKRHIHLEDLLKKASSWRLLDADLDTLPTDSLQCSSHDVFVLAPSFSGPRGLLVAFPSHRVVLAARHSYFGSLFSRWTMDQEKGRSTAKTSIPDADSQVTALILNYLYGGSRSISSSLNDQRPALLDYGECACSPSCSTARACIRSAVASSALLLPSEFTTACTSLAQDIIISHLTSPSCLMTLLRDAALMENMAIVDAAVDKLSTFDHDQLMDETEEWEGLHEPLVEAIQSAKMRRESVMSSRMANYHDQLHVPAGHEIEQVLTIARLESCLVQLYR